MNSGTAAATAVQQLKTLCDQLCSEERHPRDIATWMPKGFLQGQALQGQHRLQILSQRVKVALNGA
jgi:hypothetical protein